MQVLAVLLNLFLASGAAFSFCEIIGPWAQLLECDFNTLRPPPN